MSKKMLKRSLALSALMAFVITGSAMAAESRYVIDATTNGNTNLKIDSYDVISIEGVAPNNTNAAHTYNGNMSLTNIGKIVTDGETKDIIFHAFKGDVNIEAETINLTNFGNAFMAQGNSSFIVNATDIFLKSNGGAAITAMTFTADTADGKPHVDINTENLMVETPNGYGIYVSMGSYNGQVSGVPTSGGVSVDATGNVEIKSAKAITILDGKDALHKAAISIDANKLDITGTEYAVSAENNASFDVEVDEELTITGLVQIPETAVNTIIDMAGKTVVFNANETDYDAIAVAGNTNNLTIGDSDTQSITINGGSYSGIFVDEGADVDLTAKESIKVTGGQYGLWIQGQHKGTVVNLSAEKIEVSGMLTSGDAVVNYVGDTTITGTDGRAAIETRSGAITNINVDGGNIVKIDGDIVYGGSDNDGENDLTNTTVNLTLDRAESYFKGAIYTAKEVNGEYERTNDETSVDKGTNLTISNGATWTVTGDSFVNTLNGDGGIIAVENLDNTVEIDKDNASNLTVQQAGVTADSFATAEAQEAQLEALADAVTSGNNSVADIVAIAEGTVVGAVTAEVAVNEQGNTVVGKAVEAVNTVNQSIGEAAVAAKAHWRAHMNDMNKRMGELRMANGETGVWARMVRGETEYEGAKAQYNQYQLGYDEKLSVDKRWTVGAAVTFAEGEGSFGKGSTEDDSTAFAIYGSKLNNDGTFVDLIARYARLESDVTSYTGEASDYSTNGYSVSAEFGKRIQKGNGLWIEPQVELTYGSVDSAEYVLDGKNVQVGDMDSLIGRVGFRLGKDVKQGNVYARASYLYDFDGETETTFGKNGVTRTIEEDLGGGWWEVGVGANINLSKATYIYADVEKTFGGEVDTNWQWNLGVRYSF